MSIFLAQFLKKKMIIMYLNTYELKSFYFLISKTNISSAGPSGRAV